MSDQSSHSSTLFIFSKTINLFIKRVQKEFQKIMENEVKVAASQNGIYYSRHGEMRFIPVKIAVFEGRANSPHAYYESGSNLLAFHKRLVYLSSDYTLSNIIRHEIAHLLADLESTSHHSHSAHLADSEGPHGASFRAICHRYGWDHQDIMGASLSSEELGQTGPCANRGESCDNSRIKEEECAKVLDRVQKLLTLASSSNVHESELAIFKANQLLMKHNLKMIEESDLREKGPGNGQYGGSETETYVAQVLKVKRNSPKLSAICQILRTFLVYPVFNYVEGGVILEVTGDRANILLAEYVAEFLNQELDRLWNLERREAAVAASGPEFRSRKPLLKGLRAKNSFFYGVAQGYCKRIEGAKKGYTTSEQMALVQLGKNLDEQSKLVYGRLSSCQSGALVDRNAHELGTARGHSLQIRPGLEGDRNANREGGKIDRSYLLDFGRK